jgi:transposase InsO family protein
MPTILLDSEAAVQSTNPVRAPYSLDWVLVLGRRHLQAVLGEYFAHYNTGRPHRGLDLGVPAGRAAPREPSSLGVSRHDVLGGLIHEYRSVAA